MSAYHTVPTLLSLAILLGGCAQTGGNHPDSSPYDSHGDVRVNLVQALEIPPGEATVRLQYGRIVARNGVQETDPYCIFELETVSDQPQPVRPGSFPVTGFQRRIESFSGMPAVRWNPLGRGIGRDNGPSQMYYISEFRLRSEDQPKVRALTCQVDQGSAGISSPRHLTLAEMSQALGRFFSLELRR
jgi:hypothetical protein